MGRFFNGSIFFVEYDISLDNVPESVLVIPALATLAPVAWACQADIYLPQIDAEFKQALEEMRCIFRRFFPTISWNGQIYANEILNKVIRVPKEKSRSAMLFSGGVDSLFTFVKHKSESPILITVHGSDINLKNYKGWLNAFGNLQQLVSMYGLKHRIIRSNFRSMLDYTMLDALFKRDIGDNWWLNIHSGLGIVGLCAPLTYAKVIEKLYIASDYPANFYPYGSSHPSIDNKICWAQTVVNSDGYDLTRQDKLHFLADYIRKENLSLYIRTCWESDTGGNCSKCEKCSRTIVGLELEGINPNKHGYKVDERTFGYIKTQLETKKWHFDVGKEFFWDDLKSHIDLNRIFPHPEAREFMLWLAKVDIHSMRSHDRESKVLTNIKRSLTYLPKPIVRLLFWLFKCLKKFYLILFMDGYNVK